MLLIFLSFFSNCEETVEELEFFQNLMARFPVSLAWELLALAESADGVRSVLQQLLLCVFLACGVDGNGEDVFYFAQCRVRAHVSQAVL